MRRGLLILLALLVVTWFEFQVYPGHSYLQGETQLLVPMLERLDTPGFLSRDLVAPNPTFTFTIYDEITQSLHTIAHWNFEQALLRQQILFRFIAVLGIFLAARALKVPATAAVLLSGCVNAIGSLAAPLAFVTNPEATPVAFALSLIYLAAGLLMNRHPLPAALAGGVAILYDPVTAATFWTLVIVASLADSSLRRLLRPNWSVLLIFLLILGNIVQLQSGLGGGQELTHNLSAGMVKLTQVRTPWVWTSLWAQLEIWSYLFLMAAGIWALARIARHTDTLVRWVTIGMALSGLASVAVAMFLLAERMQLATAMPPARNLALTVAMMVLVCGAAGWYALQARRWLEGSLWAALVLAAILNPQILDLLHLQLSAAVQNQATPEVKELATWAEQKTWGSSMFQFADSGESKEAAVFRALSRRALWADWQSGVIVDYSERAGQEWSARWNATMSGKYSIGRLAGMLALPIDYYVLRRADQLVGVSPVYSNAAYVVYDAQDLREAKLRLHYNR